MAPDLHFLLVWFHLIEQISILASAYCRCRQSSVDYENQTKLCFPKHFFFPGRIDVPNPLSESGLVFSKEEKKYVCDFIIV